MRKHKQGGPVTEELRQYIEKARKDGLSDEEIAAKLKSADWHDSHIDSALKGETLVPLPPSGRPGDFVRHGFWGLEYRLMFVMLWGALAGVLFLLLRVIDSIVLRPLGSIPYGIDNTLFLPALTLTIFCYPLFAYLYLRLHTAENSHKELMHIHSRIRFAHLTVTLSLAAVIGYLSFAVYDFQEHGGGNRTVLAAVIIKATAVVLLLSAVSVYFWNYYNGEEKR